jgi:release factor glutamine methyltransferase
LYLEFERVLGPADVDRFRELVKRRSQREPLQHIVGSTSFCGFEIAVNREVLVPRPETELLAERGWTFLNERAGSGFCACTAMDLGTGSGCLAVALAAKCAAVEMVATDVSAEALAVARLNAARQGLESRIRFLQGDGFAAVPDGTTFDLIISNPPYIPTGEIAFLQPEVRDFDPHRALDGGPDGLDFARRLAAEAASFLKPDGRLMTEFGDGQAEALRGMLEHQKWVVEAVEEDYTHRPRFMVARRASDAAV